MESTLQSSHFLQNSSLPFESDWLMLLKGKTLNCPSAAHMTSWQGQTSEAILDPATEATDAGSCSGSRAASRHCCNYGWAQRIPGPLSCFLVISQAYYARPLKQRHGECRGGRSKVNHLCIGQNTTTAKPRVSDYAHSYSGANSGCALVPGSSTFFRISLTWFFRRHTLTLHLVAACSIHNW
ncbi:uncharacterized protein LOC143845051 [Paroedura picta]|uniref:uncharacterized protein LOC143845051 n=1 Tax=Paroedura picta TaxID=143630 RepID=UPI004055AFD9